MRRARKGSRRAPRRGRRRESTETELSSFGFGNCGTPEPADQIEHFGIVFLQLGLDERKIIVGAEVGLGGFGEVFLIVVQGVMSDGSAVEVPDALVGF